MSQSAVRVFARFRPPRKNHEDVGGQVIVTQSDASIKLGKQASLRSGGAGGGTFRYDGVYPHTASQQQVFEGVAGTLVQDTLEGYNSSIIAYGQTGSGKTHTMFGPGWDTQDTCRSEGSLLGSTDPAGSVEVALDSNVGLVPRIALGLFQGIQKKCEQNKNLDVDVDISVVEIYNEQLRDLLGVPEEMSSGSPAMSSGSLKIRESKRRGVWLEGTVKRRVGCAGDLLQAIRVGGASRAVASTKMNDQSSRSHVVVSINVLQRTDEGGGLCSTTRSQLFLVDLAGSERVGKTNASGQTLKEAQSINQSLSALGNCMRALTQNPSDRKSGDGKLIRVNVHIPYRDSKLTHLLKSSLGGNAKTTLIIAVASDMENLEETVSTFRFGVRAKRIQNNAHANKSMTLHELHSQIQVLTMRIHGLEKENRELKQELQHRSMGTISSSNDSEELIRRLRQDLREKDSACSAQKLAAESTGHKLKDAYEKLAVVEASWKDMQTYSSQLLDQLNDAEEKQLALQAALAGNVQMPQSTPGGTDLLVTALECEDLTLSGSDLKTPSILVEEMAKIEAVRATLNNETELLENWRSELFAWKARMDEKYSDLNVSQQIEKNEGERKQFELDRQLSELQNERVDLSARREEMVVQQEILANDHKKYSEWRESLELDRKNLHEYRLSLDTELQEIERKRNEDDEWARKKRTELDTLELSLKMKQTELNEAAKINAATENWHGEMMTWQQRIVAEYEENTNKISEAEAMLRIQKEEFEEEKTTFASKQKKAHEEAIEVLVAKHKSDMESASKELAASNNAIVTIKAELDIAKNAQIVYAAKSRELEEEIASQQLQTADEIANLKATNLQLATERNKLVEDMTEVVGEKKQIEATLKTLVQGSAEATLKILEEDSVPSTMTTKYRSIIEIAQPTEVLNATEGVLSEHTKLKDMKPLQRLRRLSALLNAQKEQSVGPASEPMQSPNDGLLAITNSLGVSSATHTVKEVVHASIAAKPAVALSVLKRIRKRSIRKQQGTHSQEIAWVEKIGEEALNRPNRHEDLPMRKNGDPRLSPTTSKSMNESGIALKEMREKLKVSMKAAHDRDLLQLKIDNYERLNDHWAKTSQDDKDRIHDLEQQLLSLYHSIEIHQQEERDYHARTTAAAKAALAQMEEDDMQFAKQLSRKLNAVSPVFSTPHESPGSPQPIVCRSFNSLDIDESYVPRIQSDFDCITDDTGSEGVVGARPLPMSVAAPVPRRPSYFATFFGSKSKKKKSGKKNEEGDDD